MGAQYRQGDVLVVAVERIPAGAVAVARDGGAVVLAYGEATGHRHAIADEDVRLLRADDELFLRVDRDAAVLRHQEHDPITLPSGAYRVIQQREYTPAAPRPVYD